MNLRLYSPIAPSAARKPGRVVSAAGPFQDIAEEAGAVPRGERPDIAALFEPVAVKGFVRRRCGLPFGLGGQAGTGPCRKGARFVKADVATGLPDRQCSAL